jgi:hypothetical protein
MGFFSWFTQDTMRSIPNKYQKIENTFTVYMHDNKGNVWEEKEYEGYGNFGGKDYFELVAEMNGQHTREEGIDLYYSGQDIYYPNLTQRRDWEYVNERPDNCPDQGFFYSYEGDEDEDEDDWEDED